MMPSIQRGLCAFALVILSTGAAMAQPPASALEVRPLLVGSEAPDSPLLSPAGEATSLHEVMGESPSILVLYRGGW